MMKTYENRMMGRTAMAWAVFNRDCNLNGAQRNPPSTIGFGAKASPDPQQFPRDFIQHAISVGAAEEVPSPSKEHAPDSAGVSKKGKRK